MTVYENIKILCILASLRLGVKNRTMTENEISKIIVDSAIEVHKTLGGAGLLECVYEESLFGELRFRKLYVEKQLEIPITYKGNLLTSPLRLDCWLKERSLLKQKL